MNKPIYFKTDRLLVREIEPSDVRDFHDIVSQEGFYYYCFDGSRESTQRFINEAIEARPISPRQLFMAAVLGLSNPNKVIGHVTLDYMPKNPDFLDLAYFVHPNCQGKGIATEAAKGMIDYAIKEFGADKVVATAHPDNKASQKVLERMGFAFTGATSVESTNGDDQRLTYEKITQQQPIPSLLKARVG
jgi:ribosomal-protein-alanine N-acetyltransferase